MKKIYTLLAAVVMTVLGALPLSAADYSAKLVIGDFAITPGKTVKVPITLEVAEAANASAIQLDIVLPEGLTFVPYEVRGVKYWFTKSDALNESQHSASMAPNDENNPTTAKLIIYSSDNANLMYQADKVELGTFEVKASESYKGSGAIKLEDVTLASSGGAGGAEVGAGIPITTTNPEVYVPVEGITLSKTELTLMAGKEEALTVTFTPEEATGNPVTWTSDKPEVATVDADGKVTAVAEGKATITATSREKTATCAVTVTAIVVTKVTIKGPEALTKGQTGTFTATVEPAEASDKTITWSSSDEKVATIDATGKVTAVGAGTTIITATAKNGVKAEQTLNVVGILVTGITLNTYKEVLKAKDTVTLTATVTPDNADNKNVKWTSSNPDVATVDENGLVTAIAVGEADIIATALGGDIKPVICTIVVQPTPVESIELTVNEKEAAEFTVGNKLQIVATIAPETATDKTLTWVSDNETVATVDENGLVTAVKVGKATITATANDGSKAEGSIEVTVLPTLVTEITVEPAEGTNLDNFVAEETIQLVATVLPENATDNTVTWTTSNNEVATVDDKGVVTALAAGSVTITATANDGSKVAGSIELTVLAIELTVEVTEYQLIKGEEVTGKFTVAPEIVPATEIELTSSNETVATASAVAKDGTFTITTIGAGNATITANLRGVEATITVTVSDELALNSPDTEDNTIPENSTVTVVANTFSEIEWSIEGEGAEFVGEPLSNPSAVVVKGLTEGATVKVIATLKSNPEITAYQEFTITEAKDVKAESITINPQSVTLRVGSNVTLSAIIAPANCTNGPVEWTSQNSAVASVNNEGQVSGLSVGTTIISARTVNPDGTSLTAVAEVTVIEATGIEGVESETEGTVSVVGGEIIVSGKAEVFSITGARVAVSVDGKVSGLAHGIYIVRTAGKSVKVRL